mgnify:CR=1 FL=1
MLAAMLPPVLKRFAVPIPWHRSGNDRRRVALAGIGVAGRLVGRRVGRLLAALLAVLPAATGGAQSYPRLEAAFDLPGLASDPFDYAATDVKVRIREPDSSAVVLPAFFDGGTTWRVRHTPKTPGLYEIAEITLNGVPAVFSGLTASNWVVAGPPSGAGHIRVDPANPRRFVTENGRRYFPVGHNVGWNASVSNDFPRMFQRMGAARENWARVWMTHFYESLNLDWPKVDNTYGKLNLTVARRWDLIVGEAEKAGLALQMVFQHHGQYSTTVNPNWNENPYNLANGGFLTNATQFFTDATAKALTKRKLRYAIARWGYSPAILAWELWNEVQYTDAANAGQWTAIAAWHDEMAAFIRAHDPYGHLITTSSDLSRDYWGAMDYYQHHNYASDMVTSSRDGASPPAQWPVKPCFDGESGSIRAPPRVWVQAPLWASLMSAQSGASCPWWWDTNIDPENAYSVFKSVRDFVELSGLAAQDGLLKSVPRVAGVPGGALAFAPGGGWQPVTQDVFVVGEGAPEGIGSATRYLHGVWHHADMGMTKGYKFLVDYAQPGTFSVQVLETSTYGSSNLRILVDGSLKTNVSFFATNGGPTNVTFTIPVAAGPHAIVLTNGAQDWVVLGDLTLNPYVPLLGAYAVGNTNFQAGWVWHRTNLYVTNATAALAGTVEVKGLRAGSYAGVWWDSFNGGVISNFTISIPSNGAAASLPTPAITRSAAFHLGLPAAAALGAPDLAQTRVTNTPTLWTTLALTNAGGLPLHYTLVLTGLSAVAYTAMNSSQAGGPPYIWRDVSAYGTEIPSAAFTALAAPKDARDEGIAGPFDLGFEFPFFSGAQAPGLYTQVYVSPNGFIAFSPFAGDRAANTTLPAAASPTNLVALFWDDLDLSAGGKIWVAKDPWAGEFTVQYEAVRFKSSSLTMTAQVVLRTTGEILCYYKALGRTNSCTVGVQDAAGASGLQVTYNSSAYLRSGLAVRLTPTPWLQFAQPAGWVPPGTTELIPLGFVPGSLPTGVYSASLCLRTSDPLRPLFHLPLTLTLWDGQLTPLQQWRQRYFGSPENAGDAANEADGDGDGLRNIFEYAFNTNPTNANASPLVFEMVDDHFRIKFPRTRPAPAGLTYRVEVSEDLGTGPWGFGPAYTTEAVFDNGDGTETVTHTLTVGVSGSSHRWVRLRVALP